MMNIQIFGTKKSPDTRKAERFFKATVGYAPDVWKTWQ